MTLYSHQDVISKDAAYILEIASNIGPDDTTIFANAILKADSTHQRAFINFFTEVIHHIETANARKEVLS